jgi:hypothetical protein
MNTWTNVGPIGGYVSKIEIDPSNASVIYAASFSGGIFKSTNHLISWNAVLLGLFLSLAVACRYRKFNLICCSSFLRASFAVPCPELLAFVCLPSRRRLIEACSCYFEVHHLRSTQLAAAYVLDHQSQAALK